MHAINHAEFSKQVARQKQEKHDEEMAARQAAFKAPQPRYDYGVLAKYAALVSSASEGAVTDKNLGL